jgi:hypothetical protein
MGHPREGYRAIREAFEDNMRLGMVAGASEILGYATEALLLAGDFDGAEAQLNEALAIAGDVNERVYLPQLYLMEAAIARSRGERTVAEASVRRAIAEARAQEAPWLELMALIELAEHHSATAKDRRALAARLRSHRHRGCSACKPRLWRGQGRARSDRDRHPEGRA